jgi:hypothetical protein
MTDIGLHTPLRLVSIPNYSVKYLSVKLVGSEVFPQASTLIRARDSAFPRIQSRLGLRHAIGKSEKIVPFPDKPPAGLLIDH